jgi:drug/metabolite transporter (DMT)-like permease
VNKSFVWPLATILAWSVSYSIIKLALDYMGPIPLLEMRLVTGGLILLAVARGVVLGKRETVSALLNVALFLVLLNLGVQLSENPALSAVLIYTQPAFVIVLSVLSGETVNVVVALGTAIALAGAVVSAGSVNFDLGSLVSIAGGFVWALGTLYHRKYLAKEDLLKLNVYYAFSSALIDSPLLVFDHRFELSTIGVVYAVLSGILAQAVGFVAWFKGVEAFGPFTMSNLGLLVPPMSYVFAFLILGDVPTYSQVIGSALVVGGVALANAGGALSYGRRLRDRGGK